MWNIVAIPLYWGTNFCHYRLLSHSTDLANVNDLDVLPFLVGLLASDALFLVGTKDIWVTSFDQFFFPLKFAFGLSCYVGYIGKSST